MSASLGLSDLIEYTEWERGEWHGWLRQRHDDVLAIGAGAQGDGRFQTVGDLIKHIFSAEKRYIDRLSNRPITDAASIPNDSVEALFQFGAMSRADLKEYVEALPAHRWEVPQDFNLMNKILTATPRKIIVHVLMHEIRHWAQIATLLRLSGLPGDFHDFLLSPVLGGEFRQKANG